MKRVKLVLLDKGFPEECIALEEMLYLFQKEVYGSSTKVDLEMFVKHHLAIYLIMYEDQVVGFSSFVYNPYYGLREPTIGNDYIYILPEFRRSNAMHMISIQAGQICVDHNLSLEHYIASDESELLSKRLSGDKIFTTYIYSIDEVTREYNRLKTKVKIK